MMSFEFNAFFKKLTGNMLAILILVAAIACNEQAGNSVREKTVQNNSIVFASRISIEKLSGYTKVTIINPWQGADNVNMTYYLVHRGAPIPSGIDSTRIIMVPLQKIVCMSTTHVAMISAIGEQKSITGMSGTGFMYSEDLKNRSDSGYIKDVGYESNLNKELILKLRPDVTMIYGVGSESSGYVGKIEELGIKVIYNADYLETEPLGKAEWIKLFGALYCRERMADSIFNIESESYNKLKLFIAGNISQKPSVLLGLPFKDTWFVSPGNSFISKLVSDAGGSYLWKDTKSAVSMPFGLENVYLKAVNADYWLNIGTVRSKDEISAVDPRLVELSCYKQGNLFNNNNRVSAAGGNDFWESGTVYPHIIMKDIATILHPELFPDNKLYYYRKIN
jgi:iron complex transport system substrate-binding protein